MKSFIHRAKWSLAMTGLILAGSLLPIKELLSPHYTIELTNALHYPSGILLGVVWVPVIRHSARLVLMFLAAGIALFGVIEWIQPLFGRTCSLMDWLQSSAGIALGMASSLLHKDTPRAFKRLFLMVGTAMLIAFSLPLFSKLQLLEVHEKRFPLISDFESGAELALWYPGEHIQVTVESKDGRFASLAEQFPEVAMQNMSYARVSYPDNHVAQMTYSAVVTDWRGYRRLCFDARADRAGQTLTVELAERSGPEAGLRFWRQTYPNPAQWHTLCVPLEGLRHANGDAFDFSRVDSLSFIGPEKVTAGWFDFDTVRLSR